MTANDLLMALTDVEDDLILDAQKVPKKERPGRRRLVSFLAAAAVASTMILTAFASSDAGAWFKDFFAGESELGLTDSQKTYIGENTNSYQQSKTMNGYTVTLESAISDGVRMLVQFKVTAPEDVVLDLDTYTPSNWGSSDLFLNEVGATYSTSGGWDTIDEDKTDNSVILLYESDNFWYEKQIDQIFGHTWTIRLVGLDGRNRMTIENMDDPPQKQHITDGVWEFEIQFPETGNEELEFVSEPVPCPVFYDHSEQGPVNFDSVNITSLRLRALGTALAFAHPEKGEINAYFETIYAVTKDGSRVAMHDYYGGPGFVTFTFEAPVVPQEIDHILLPDGTQLRAQ